MTTERQNGDSQTKVLHESTLSNRHSNNVPAGHTNIPKISIRLLLNAKI
jgi:hypothetical protein